MIDLKKYPNVIRQELDKFRPVLKIWKWAAQCDFDDVCNEFATSIFAGEDPVAAVPARLGIRRLPCGRWVASDPLCHSSVFDLARHDVAALQIDDDDASSAVPIVDADGIEHIMKRCGIGRRAAQIRVKKQLLAMQAQGDFFAEVAP